MPTNKTTEQASIKLLIAGTQKHFASATSLTLGSTTYTPAALEQLFQSLLDAFDGVATAQGAYKAKLVAERTLATPVRAVIRVYRTWVLATFSKSPDVLADFGISPHKAKTPTAAIKAVAVVKRVATREARHTLGKRQKEDIKGTVPVSPPPAAPPVVVAPAPKAPGGAHE